MGRLSKRLEEMIQADIRAQSAPTNIVEDIVANEHKGPIGIIDDIKQNPVPKGIAMEEIGGVPLDWHDLENFVLSISPTKFVNLLKLQKQMIKDYGLRFKGQRKTMNTKIILLIMLAIGLAVIGVCVILFMPQLLAMFQGGI